MLGLTRLSLRHTAERNLATNNINNTISLLLVRRAELTIKIINIYHDMRCLVIELLFSD